MKNKNLGLILVIMGGMAIFSEHDSAWIVSAICVGVGTGLFFTK
jgi:hypothetical protein